MPDGNKVDKQKAVSAQHSTGEQPKSHATGEERQINAKPPLDDFETFRNLRGHARTINRVAWSPDNKRLATTSHDKTIRIWDLTRRDPPVILRGHSAWVSSAAWSPDSKFLASVSGDLHIRLWDAASGEMLLARHAHARTIFDVAWSPDGQTIATGSGDLNVAIWDAQTLKLIRLLPGHSGAVYRIAWAPDGSVLASASADGTVRLWEVGRGITERIHEGHSGAIYDLAWSSNGHLASASEDKTIRLWGLTNAVLEGHTDCVTSLSFSSNSSFMASKSLDGTVRLWRCDTWEQVKVIPELSGSNWTAGIAFHPVRATLATLDEEDTLVRIWRFNDAALRDAIPVMPTVRYTNAKVVLVGDSGVGKTSLANALMGKPLEPTYSTHGRHVHRFSYDDHRIDQGVNEIREIFLWDLAGQPTYRLIHQLHLNEVVVAVVVFDVKSSTDPFAGVRHWTRALHHAQQIRGKNQVPLITYLVAARVDRGGVGVSGNRVDAVMGELNLDGYFETSVVDNLNIAELNTAIRGAIDWDNLPRVNSTILFQSIKNFLNRVREKGQENGRLLHDANDLYEAFRHSDDAPSELDIPDLRDQFDTCISLVEARGLIRRFSFGNLILLQPELLDSYASALLTVVRDEPDGMGMVTEEDARQGRFKMPEDERIDDKEQELLLLAATVEDLIRHEIAMRDVDDRGISYLVFPSQSSRTTPRPPDADARTAIWNFEGPVLNIYTTLAVRLWNTGQFALRDMYENAVFYQTQNGDKCRMYFTTLDEGHAEITLYFDDGITTDTELQIEAFVESFLRQRAIQNTLRRRRLVICSKCGTVITDAQVQKRREMKLNWIRCNVCDTQISLDSRREQLSMSQSFLRQQQVLQMDKQAELQRRRQVNRAQLEGRRLTDDFDVFLCHNGRDKEAVKKVGEALKDRGILPWLDEWELPPGQPWPPLVQKQLQKMHRMLFFVGPNGIGTWQENEVFTFMEMKGTIIPVILPNAPRNPDIPPFLKRLTWVDFRKVDPNPLKQLIWGIKTNEPHDQQDQE